MDTSKSIAGYGPVKDPYKHNNEPSVSNGGLL
jgi:hypothetical protein